MTTVDRNTVNFQRPLNRPNPVGPVQAYKTYSIEAPLSSHWRDADCEEVGCLQFHNGFRTTVDLSTELGQAQFDYIVKRSGRAHGRGQDGTIVTFLFPPGTQCFSQHKIRIDRPPLLVVRNGDWRRYLETVHVHQTPESWVDDFATHQDKLVRYLQPERG